MKKNKLLLLLALLLTAATGAWAQTTYTVAGSNSAMFGTAWDASNTTNDMTKNGDGTYSITYTNVYLEDEVQYKVVKDHSWNEAYPDGDNRVITIAEAGTYTLTIHFNPNTHEVYETKPGYTVSLKDGVKDADKWTVKVGDGQAQALPIGGLKGDGKETVTLQYTGRLKVKGVKATSDAPAAKPAATVTTAPQAKTDVEAGSTTALIEAGVADGGTMMYKVTTENTKPASTDGFSDAVPTAKDIAASGKVYVWYYVKGDDTHSDSEIAATAIEVPVADIIWDITNVSDLYVEETYASYTKEGVKLSANAENIFAGWNDNGDPKTDGICFQVYGLGGFTFTAPAGKEFTKIEMNALGYNGWNEANLGIGWAYSEDETNNIYKVTWTGSADSTDALLPLTDDFVGENVISIAFYLVDAE